MSTTTTMTSSPCPDCGCAKCGTRLAALEDLARKRAPVATCKPWCGTVDPSCRFGRRHPDGCYGSTDFNRDGTSLPCYCAQACADAGRPLNPASPPAAPREQCCGGYPTNGPCYCGESDAPTLCAACMAAGCRWAGRNVPPAAPRGQCCGGYPADGGSCLCSDDEAKELCDECVTAGCLPAAPPVRQGDAHDATPLAERKRCADWFDTYLAHRCSLGEARDGIGSGATAPEVPVFKCDRCGGGPRYGESNVCRPCALREPTQPPPPVNGGPGLRPGWAIAKEDGTKCKYCGATLGPRLSSLKGPDGYPYCTTCAASFGAIVPVEPHGGREPGESEIRVSPAEFARIEELIANPPPPTEALRKLMRPAGPGASPPCCLCGAIMADYADIDGKAYCRPCARGGRRDAAPPPADPAKGVECHCNNGRVEISNGHYPNCGVFKELAAALEPAKGALSEPPVLTDELFHETIEASHHWVNNAMSTSLNADDVYVLRLVIARLDDLTREK